jgi:hypothetical protein
MKKLTASALVLALAAVAASQAQAQSASITATATVQQQLTVTAGQNLAFGNVFPGTSVGVLASDAASGSFSLAGAANAELTLTFTLPANLTDGTDNLPIAFSSTAAGYNTVNSRAGLSLFNPAAVATTRLHAASGELYVFIGGSVSPTTQGAGVYSGSIQLAAAYTGN